MAYIPGVQLRNVVEEVRADLTDDVDARLIADRLRGALASTAARGETCHLAPAVAAIRQVMGHLDAGRRQDARQTLDNALACLPRQQPSRAPHRQGPRRRGTNALVNQRDPGTSLIPH